VDLKRSKEQVIDNVSQDEVLGVGLSPEARERAAGLTASFEQFLTAHRDEFIALQLLYGSREGRRLSRAAVEELAKQLAEHKPPLAPEAVWRAYAMLDKSRVRGAPARLLTDVVSLVRYAVHRTDELAPLPQTARPRFDAWVVRHEAQAGPFTPEQRAWLEEIYNHVAANLEISAEDFEYSPFAQRGGLGAAYRAFGKELTKVMDELTAVVAA
jgi:type I restriction enzyme R subunit